MLFTDIINSRFSIITNQVPVCASFKAARESGEETPLSASCILLNELLSDFLAENSKAKILMPENWLESYKCILIGLGRLEKLTLYMRIPPELWTLGWNPEISDLDHLAFPSIPIEFLHDKDILQVYVKRLLILGWDSRKQFEESWMALLGVFSLSKDDLSEAEIAALTQASTIAVSAITGLLLQTLMLPRPGQGNLSQVN